MARDPTDASWRRKVGHSDQLFGTRLVRLADGGGDGSRLLQVWTAGGLCFDVAVDRGFDIYRVIYRGRTIDWVGPPGFRSRFAYEPGGWGWLRNFHGGLVVTCGLDHILFPITRKVPEYGFPADRDIEFGLHGRVSNEGADLLAREIEDGDVGPVMRVRGSVTQSSLYNETLVLDRVMTVPAFGSELSIIDTVTNRGFRPTHHEILYHVNFGYPLIDAGTEIRFARLTGEEALVVSEPQLGFREQVTSHDMASDERGRGQASVVNRAAGVSVGLTYSARSLPRFNVWYMMEAGVYAVGLEPMSLRPEDRDPENLDFLGPQESRRYELAFQFADASGRLD
jgi:hypothetical protein